MPRKKWVLKNALWKGSKLNDFQFNILVHCYFYEVTHNITRKMALLYYLTVAPVTLGTDRIDLMFIGDKLSKQTMGKYFSKFGQHIWDNFFLTDCPELDGKSDIFDDLLDLIYGKIDELPNTQNILHQQIDLLLSYFEDNSNFTSSLMFHLLRNRSKVIKGYKKDTFYLELSRVTWVCFAIHFMKENRGIDYSSIYSVNDKEFEGYFSPGGGVTMAFEISEMATRLFLGSLYRNKYPVRDKKVEKLLYDTGKLLSYVENNLVRAGEI